MGYVVVVFAIINTAALAGLGVVLFYITKDMPGWVETAIQVEVRKQDDRIEKRLVRAQGPVEDSGGTTYDGMPGVIRPGKPLRR